jgi:hypothetical protein
MKKPTKFYAKSSGIFLILMGQKCSSHTIYEKVYMKVGFLRASAPEVPSVLLQNVQNFLLNRMVYYLLYFVWQK